MRCPQLFKIEDIGAWEFADDGSMLDLELFEFVDEWRVG